MFKRYGAPLFSVAFCTVSGSLPPVVRVGATAFTPVVSKFFAAECAAAFAESAYCMNR